MKKLGFTLSELLVSMGIIGVIASITIPMLSNLMPDRDKMQVVKAYRQISDITKDMLEDRGIYPVVHMDGGNPWDTCIGLQCVADIDGTDVINPEYAELPRVNTKVFRYPSLLCYSLGVDPDDYENSFDAHILNCSTPDGKIYRMERMNNDTHHQVTLDINGDDGPNQSYDADHDDYDQFVFVIDNWGHVSGRDALTRAYLANPMKFNTKRQDLETAGNLPVLEIQEDERK